MNMMAFLVGGGIGIAVGLILVPLVFWIIVKVKDTKERKHIKEMIKEGKIIFPIDEKDFDTKMWRNHIDLDEMKKTVDNLDNKIFKRNITEDTQ